MRPFIRQNALLAPSVFPGGGMLQRSCACGRRSSLTGTCLECERNKFVQQPGPISLRIGEPDDEFEREADRVATEVMQKPAAFFHRAHGPNRPSHVPLVIQREVDDREDAGVPASPHDKIKKPELEFHSALHFNRTFSGFNPTSEPEAGGYGIIWWSVWNTGWERAGEHTNRLTVYDANKCSGCRHEKDEIFRADVPGPSIVAGTEPGESDYDNGVLVGPLSAGQYDAYVELDVGRQVDEINEYNNVAFMVFTVRPGKESESESEGTVQRTSAAETGSPLSQDSDARFKHTQVGGKPLDRATRDWFSAKLGYDFTHVRVHTDTEAAESARAVNALAFTVGNDIVFGAGQYAPGTRAGQRLLAHELTHVVQQTAGSTSAAPCAIGHRGPVSAVTASTAQGGNAPDCFVQRQAKTDGPSFRDLPILLEKLKLDVDSNLFDYGHHLYQAAILHPDEPAVLQNTFSRYALGLNVLKDSYRFAGFAPDTADKLALGTGVLFKGLTFLRQGEVTLDFQINLGRGVKVETNLSLGVNPKDVTEVRKADATIGLVGRF